MTDQTIVIEDIPIAITRKRIKRLNLRVHPPDGRVTISAPRRVPLHEVQAFAAAQVEWIRRHRERIAKQEKKAPLQFVTGECHFVWGHPHLLNVVERHGRQGVSIESGQITLQIRRGSDVAGRARVMQTWHKAMLNEVVPPMVQKWEQRMNVRCNKVGLRWMTTRWGSCNPRRKHIRLNTELATKAIHLLEYVVVHEMVHFSVANHGPRFVDRMNEHYPGWREARKELNASSTRPPRKPIGQ